MKILKLQFPIFPFALSLESLRWEATEGKIKPGQYNKRWWELIRQNMGIVPPSDRSSSNLFDPAGIYHIAADYDFLNYFVSGILQFQFFEGMGNAAGE